MIPRVRISQTSEIIHSAWGMAVQHGVHAEFVPTGEHLVSTDDYSPEGYRFIADPELVRMSLPTTRH